MPVRNMLYDGVAYTDQIIAINRLHKKTENIYDALIEALANAGRIQEMVRCTSDKEYKKKLLSEFNLS